MDFLNKLNKSITQNNSLVCIGLDTEIVKLPTHLQNTPDNIFTFNQAIVDATFDLVCCYKINIAFYEAAGVEGLMQMKKTIDYIHSKHNCLTVILDAKRSDIGNTARMYAQAAFQHWNVDAITVNPYLGSDSVLPFVEYKEKGVIVVCKSSNPNAGDFQNLQTDGKPLYIKVARKIAEWNTKYNNCLMVVGPVSESLEAIRRIAPDMFFLVPGIGTQDGNLEGTLKSGLTQDKSGLIIHSAREIIYASSTQDFAQKARLEAQVLRNKINKYR